MCKYWKCRKETDVHQEIHSFLPDPGQRPDFYTWLTLGLVAGTFLQLQQQQKPFIRPPKGLWERLFRCTKKKNLLFALAIKFGFYLGSASSGFKHLMKMFTYKEHTHGLFFPNEVGTEAETEVSFIAPAPRSYSCPRQLLTLKMLYFVFCLKYVPKSSSFVWPPDVALCQQKSCLYLRHFPPACVWSVFWRHFLGLGFCILQDNSYCIFHSGGVKPSCHAERSQLEQACKHRSR